MSGQQAIVAVLDAKLSRVEASHLKKLEASIKKGMKSFMVVGAALLEVRDARLYRQKFGTFEDYCQKRWGMSKTHANRLVEGAKVVANLTPIGVKRQPENEAQVRPLSDLPPAAQRSVWQSTLDRAEAEDERVTAALVQETRDQLFPPGTEIPTEFQSEQEPCEAPQSKRCPRRVESPALFRMSASVRALPRFGLVSRIQTSFARTGADIHLFLEC